MSITAVFDMSNSNKSILEKTVKINKRVTDTRHSTDNEHVVWRFDWIDRSGEFAFDINRNDFKHKEILEKIINYNSMTWGEVKLQTHDRYGKSKNHYLDYDGISDIGKKRIHAKHFDEYTDSIFSFSLMNVLRIIGIRIDNYFYAVWYDPNHKFYLSKK